ncbi:MAG: methylated-DNA--[protein]-cysteine S-methyltransferase [Candidatus Aenigmatarchaeota archaeon]|nr:MAG: methylated-DNA--[protein]-cysteine S-methyltransferase [Candidatus Aenigmarchaeota archaeon]
MFVRVAGARLEVDESLIRNKSRDDIAKDVDAYMKRRRLTFEDYDVDMKPFTHFQRRVLVEMRHIPFGMTFSYKRLAELVGRPHAYRAVANVCATNALPIIIPCHRVVGSHSLGGYSAGLGVKKALLRLEMGH